MYVKQIAKRGVDMKFFMISDLHLDNNDNDLAKENIMLLASKIRDEVSPNEAVLFVVLGDLIDKGQKNAFDSAEKYLNLLREELRDYKVKFEFIPGNHDLVDKKLDDFDNFIKKMGADYSFTVSTAVSKNYGGVNFIFANSTLTNDYNESGELDLGTIRSLIKDGMQNTLFCHHSLTHHSEDEHNCVKDGKAISATLRKMGIDFCFHSHTHTCDITISGEQVPEIGCGSISKDVHDMPEINNQFSVGGIRDGKIVGIERWVKTGDGKGRLAYEALFPKERKFMDPEKIGKKQYPNVSEPYIAREINQTDGDNSYLHPLQRMPLVDVLGEKGRIFLLGNAGDGKTIELQKLAHDLYETPFFPFLYFLKDYTDETIDDIIPKQYADLNPNRLVLIFDGYDEIQEKYRHNFKGKLNSYLGNNPSARVIVSARRNFCKMSSNGKSRTIRDFVEYEFAPISADKIKEYLSELKIDLGSFLSAAELSQVNGLVYNPFYLSGLARIFLANKMLPSKNLVMENIIERCFLRDDEKFSNNDLNKIKFELFQCLEKVAFAMQLLCKNQITDDEYQQIIPKDQRELIERSGLFSRSNDNTWQFSHNNFREYLAAKHLAKMPIDQVLKYCCVGNEVKPSWANTFGYFIGISDDVELRDWAVNNACETLVKYDPESIDVSMHFEIFKSVFEKYEQNYIHSYEGLCSEGELACFACSTKGIDYLIKKIDFPVNRFSLHNALRIMQHLPDTRGKQTAMRDCLLKFCEGYPHNRSDDCRSAIHAICQQNLYNSNVTKKLMGLYNDCDNDFIRTGMYEYLVYTNEQDSYVQFFLDGIRFIGYSRFNGRRIGNESWALLDGLKAMSSVQSISSVLAWFCTSENTDFYNNDEVFCTLAVKASNLYQEGGKQLFEVIYKCWIWALKLFRYKEIAAASNFFKETGGLENAVLRLISTANFENVYIRDLLNICPEIIDVLERLYRENHLPSKFDFSEFVIHNFGGKEYIRFSKIIYDVENKMLPELPPPVDFAKERKEASLEYLSYLFDKCSYKELIEKLFLEVGNDNITVGELKDNVKEHKYYLPLARVKFAVRRRLFPNQRVKDFFKIVDWLEFCVVEIRDLIRNESLELDNNQKGAIAKIVLEECKKGIFDKAFSKDGGLWENVCSTVQLAVMLEIPLNDIDLSKLTAIPWYAFSDKEDVKKYLYLEKTFSESALVTQVVKDVQSDSVDPNTLAKHIDYLRECHCNEIADSAREKCIQEDKDTELSRSAVKYLHDMFGSEYIGHEVLPYCSSDLMKCIAQMFDDIDQGELKSAMEKVYSQKYDTDIQAYLITFNCKSALEDYVEYVRNTKSVPQNDGNPIGGTTVAISCINDLDLVSLLEELIKIAFSPDFKDREYNSLSGSLYKAFENCAKTDYNRILSLIDDLSNYYKGEENIIYFCRLKNDILRENIENQDIPLSIGETSRIISSIN